MRAATDGKAKDCFGRGTVVRVRPIAARDSGSREELGAGLGELDTATMVKESVGANDPQTFGGNVDQ